MSSIVLNIFTLKLILFILSRHYIFCEEDLSTKDKALKEYIRSCPRNNYCTQVGQLFGPPFGLCCGECNCSESCGYDCCPDGPQTFMSEEEIAAFKRNDIVKCLSPNLEKNELTKQFKKYEFIAGCPFEFEDSTVKEKCLTPFEEFDLGEYTWNVPVTSSTSGNAYKNLYCAMCNGEGNETLIIWDVILRCLRPFSESAINFVSIANVTSVLEISSDIRNHCNVIYEVPSLQENLSTAPVPEVRECSGVIDRCNVTGNWAFYDPDIESSCLSYKSEYQGYRNIHCFMCNGGNISNLEIYCFHSEVSVYTPEIDATLAVQNAVFQSELACRSDFIFDISMKACRQLHCSEGFVLDGLQCVPFLRSQLFGLEIYHVYAVTLTFEPDISSLTKKVTRGFINEFILHVTNDVNRKLDAYQSTEFIAICDSRSFVKFKQSSDSLINTLHRAERKVLFYDVIYMAISLRVSVFNTSSVPATVENLLNLYNLTRLNITGILLMPRARFIDPAFVDRITNHAQRDSIRNGSDVDFIKSLELNIYIENALISSLPDNSDGLAVALIRSQQYGEPGEESDCRITAAIEVDVFCPKIELKPDEFETDGSSIRLVRLNEHISRNVGYYGSGWSMLRICREEYMKIVEKAVTSRAYQSTNQMSFFYPYVVTMLLVMCL